MDQHKFGHCYHQEWSFEAVWKVADVVYDFLPDFVPAKDDVSL